MKLIINCCNQYFLKLGILAKVFGLKRNLKSQVNFDNTLDQFPKFPNRNFHNFVFQSLRSLIINLKSEPTHLIKSLKIQFQRLNLDTI